MKTRTALIYLGVFLLLAGYFYYFEVVRREARIKEEEAARRLFQVEKDEITALKLDQTDSELISLQKNDRWHIVEPLKTRADEPAVDGLLSDIQSLKVEREVKANAENLEPYGLDNPKLHLSFLAAGTWHGLRVGTKAVVGDNFYASGDQERRVLLISGSKKRALGKSLFDLRSKELFGLKNDEVDEIEIERSGEDNLALVRVDKAEWQASTVPDLKIRASKVENLLNRLVWLRATRFLDQSQANDAGLGLSPPRIRISLSGEERTEVLLIGNTKKNEGIYAKSEQLPGVAMVDEKLLQELPGNLRNLEDRTFLAFELEEISALNLEIDGETARLERQGEKWRWVGDSDRKDPENWMVNSLLWKIQDLEHLPESPSSDQPFPEKKQLNLVLFSDKDNKVGSFVLGEVPSEKVERGIVWFLKGGGTMRPFLATAASLQDLHQSAKRLLTDVS